MSSCIQNVHSIIENKHTIDRSKCIKCNSCVEACPSSDIQSWSTSTLGFAGTEIEDGELYQLLKPQLNLLRNIGGLTVSGGDPILQSHSLAVLFKRFAQENIHITVETSASSTKANIQKLLPFVNHWLIGLRPSLIDKANVWEQVVENLTILAAVNKKNITIRTPIIPNYTNSLECYSKIKDVMTHHEIKNLELLPFNPYAESYYRALGADYMMKNASPISEKEVDEAKDYFLSNGIHVKIVN